MSAIGLSAPGKKGFTVSAYADVRHEHLFFERQQSLALRYREWEDREQPLLSWSTMIVRGMGVMIFTSALYLMTGAVVLYGILRCFDRDHQRILKSACPEG